MSQRMNVVHCSGCQMFQVEIQKKAKKWQCKVCGAKQSLMEVFFQGTGKQCRLQAQRLNSSKPNCENDSDSQLKSIFTSCNDYFDFNTKHSKYENAINPLKRYRSGENTESMLNNSEILTSDEESHDLFKKRFKSESEFTEDSENCSRDIFLNVLQDEVFKNIEECIKKTESQKLKTEQNSIFSSIIEDEDEDDEIFEEAYFSGNKSTGKTNENSKNHQGESIFSNLLTDDESDSETVETMLIENNSILSTEEKSLASTLLKNDDMIDYSAEIKSSIFESNNDIDLSLDF